MVVQADLPFETVCVLGLGPQQLLKQTGPVGWYILLVHLGELGMFPLVLRELPPTLAIR